MPFTTFSIRDLPATPAVYAMYGGRGGNAYVAYVGIGENLKRRIGQHLYRRDSSIVTGVSAVSLNPDLVTKVEWWTAPEFADSSVLEAAELVAFDFFEPVLRSRGKVSARAIALSNDEAFRGKMVTFFEAPPEGMFIPQSLQSLTERVASLEERIRELEGRSK
jgi:hypothetical protein